MVRVRLIIALALTIILCPILSCASDGPFFHHVILKRNKYITYKTHYPDDIYLCYEGDVDIPFQCFYQYNRTVHLVVEIVRPPITGFRRVDVVLYMGIDRKLVGMDREVSKVKTFIVNTPDVRPLRPFEKVFQEPENLNVRIKMYPEIAGKVLRQMNNKDIIKDDRVDRIPCLFKVWWQCN